MINNLDTIGANSLVAFKLNNEAIPISQTRAVISDYGAGYTITIQSSELAEGDNIISCQILESDDTYPITLEYTYNTQGGGELVLKPYIQATIQPTTINAGTTTQLMMNTNTYNYNYATEGYLYIKFNVDYNEIPQTEKGLPISQDEQRQMQLFSFKSSQPRTINYTITIIKQNTLEVVDIQHGTVQVTT